MAKIDDLYKLAKVVHTPVNCPICDLKCIKQGQGNLFTKIAWQLFWGVTVLATLGNIWILNYCNITLWNFYK